MTKTIYGLAVALFASAFFTTMAVAGDVTLCTGSRDAPYFQAGHAIAEMAKGSGTNIHVVESGGTWDNIQKSVSAEPECDAFIGQPDGHAVLDRQNKAAANKLRKIASLHREYLHVICNVKSGVDALDDLESDPVGNGYSVAVGEQGSGSWLIWQNFIVEDEDYGAVPVTNEGGVFALSSVASGNTTCMLVPAGLRNGTVTMADSDYSGELILASAADGDFNDAEDPRGERLYEFADIPSGTYPTSLQTGFFGSSVETVSWFAGLYANSDLIDKQDLANLIKAANRAKAAIKANFGS